MSHADSKRERKEYIEQLLIGTREGLTMEELAERAECSVSTVSRYLQEFERSGKLIEVSKGRYKLDASKYISNISFSIPEALSIYLALRRFIRQTNHAPQFMIDALQKIAPALRHPDLTESLVDASENLRVERRASQQEANIWQTLLESWRENIVVRIEYVKLREDAISVHEIEPYLFEPAILSQGTYIIAWSQTRRDLRTFKIDRIRRASLTTQPFIREETLNVEMLLRHAWGVWYGKERIKVELKFAPTVVDRVQETIWHPTQETDELADGSLYWCVEVAATLELIPWIRGWGHEVEVLAPASLRQEIASSLRAAAKLYEGEK